MTSIFSPIRPAIVCLALTLFLPGCPPAASPNLDPTATPPQSAAETLRLRTDSLLHALALYQIDNLKTFFPPGANVDVLQQLNLYLKVPYPRTRLLGWNAGNILVQLSADGRFARTGLHLEFLASDPKAAPTQQDVTFEWQAAEKGSLFYLVPLKPPAS